MVGRRHWAAMGLSAALLALGASSALAGNITTTGGIRSGPLSVATGQPSSLSTTLSGDDLLVSGSLGEATVIDATGSGAGWKLTISGTAFKNAAGKVLPNDALTITGVTTDKKSGRAPTNTTTYPVTVPLGDSPTAVKFVSAAADSGMGKFSITPAVALSVPADTYAGDYASTITISVVAGP